MRIVSSELARQAAESGARFELPRRFRLWGPPTREATPEEAAERLDSGVLQVRTPDQKSLLPVKDAEDLKELLVFAGQEPASGLAHPELAAELQQMAQEGWRFSATEHAELGPYGAYNALTDPRHGLSGLAAQQGNLLGLPVGSEEELQNLASFYREDPLGTLERKGYQFFDGHGQRRAAFGSQAPASIGKSGEVWLPVNQAARLAEFELLDPDMPNPALTARALAYRHGESDLSGVFDLPAEERQALARVALEKHQDQPDLAEVGLEAVSWRDDAMQTAWLEALERRPERAAMARLMLEQRGRVEAQETRWALWKTALENEKPGLAAVASLEALLEKYPYDQRKSDREKLAPGFLAALPEARRLDRWHLTGSAYTLEQLPQAVGKSDRELALACTTWKDLAAQDRQLAELDPDGPALRLRPKVSCEETRWALWKAAMMPGENFRHKVDEVLSGVSYDGKATDLEKLDLLLFQEQPETPALRQLKAWDPADWAFARKGFVQHSGASTPEELRALALDCTTWQDEAMQTRQLEGIGARGALRLRERVQRPETAWAIWKATMQDPARDAAALYQGVVGLVDSIAYDGRDEDLGRLAGALAEQSRQEPSAARALKALDAWQPKDWNFAWKGFLKHPRAATPEELRQLALDSTTWADEDMQTRQLQEFPEGKLALEIRPKLQCGETRWAVWKAAMLDPSADVGKLAASAHELVKSIPYDGREADLARLDGAVFDQMALAPECQLAAARLKAWQPADEAYARKGFMANSRATTPEELRQLALDCTTWKDEAMQDRQLEELKQDASSERAAGLALRTRGQLQRPESRWALWKAVMQEPTARNGKEAEKLCDQVEELLAAIPYEGKAEDLSRMRQLVVSEAEVYALVDKGPPAAVRVEEQRVVVGGVVLRRSQPGGG